MRRRPLHAELVRRSLAATTDEANDLVAAHRVLVNGSVADNAAHQVAPGDAVVVEGPPARFVGRGARKLDHALDEFALDVAGIRALDAGASTGGFTDCLLQRGVASVVALDVGRGQLHERLRTDERVIDMERSNVRHITVDSIGGAVDIVVADLSFISLKPVIPTLVSVCKPGAPMVLLVKPQFEARRAEVDKGRGIIGDTAIHERVQAEIADTLVWSGCDVVAWVTSPITGANGNKEFLVLANTPAAQERQP